VAASAAAGLATLALVVGRRFEPARYTAALAVAAIVAGWGIAQNPLVLSDLTVSQAAASRSTLIAVIAAVVGGGIVLFPSLGLLFRLVLGGRLGHGAVADDDAGSDAPSVTSEPGTSRVALRLAAALGVVGVGLTTVADADWAHGIGVCALLGLVIAGVAAVRPASL